MPTTMTATPDLDTASVRLVVSAPPAETPKDVLTLTAAQIVAEGMTAWTGGHTAVSLFGDVASFYSPTASDRVARALTGLTVGRKVRVTVTAVRTDERTTFGVTGKVTGAIPAGAGTWAHIVEFTATATTHELYVDIVSNSLPYLASVKVTVLPPAYDYARFSLTRTDANGVRPVRLLEGQEITDGSLVVEDAEAALTGAITYQLTSALGAITTASTTLDGVVGYYLHPALHPQWTAVLPLVTGYFATRTAATIVHEVIGRPDPVARLGALRLRRGTLTLWCESYEALTAALDVYRRGEVVLLRQGDYAGLDMYHIATDTQEEGFDPEYRRWRLAVTFVEVAVPRGGLLGSPTWTWDDLAATYPTWDAVMAAFPDWNAVQIGPTR